jgi:hypothetical protein
MISANDEILDLMTTRETLRANTAAAEEAREKHSRGLNPRVVALKETNKD